MPAIRFLKQKSGQMFIQQSDTWIFWMRYVEDFAPMKDLFFH